jgi:DNA-binding beta-propeller fold protein YncE
MKRFAWFHLARPRGAGGATRPVRVLGLASMLGIGVALGVGGFAGVGSAGCGASGAYDGGDPGGDDDGAAGVSDAGGAPSQCFSSNDCPVGWTCSEFGQCEPPSGGGKDGGTTPPEVEREFGVPTSALRFLYVAMPELDALAKIDGQTLEVTSVAVGERPKLVAVIPGGDDAISFDRAHDTVTIVRPTALTDQKTVLATLPQQNRVALDRTGRFALAWFDLTTAIKEAGTLGNVGEIGSLQDVTVLGLTRDHETASDLAVGFRVREVEFDDAGTKAFVITDDGVSVVDLAQAAAGTLHVAATIPIVADPLADLDAVDVDITADGAWAVAREHGKAELRVVGLLPGAPAYTVPLAAEATDVDLGADGRHAYAVLRDAHALLVLDIPADAADPSGIDTVDLGGEVVGSAVIDQARHRALLFTNAASVERLIDVDLEGADFPFAVRKLQKGVRAVAIAPDGQTALVLHSKAPGDPLGTGNLEDFVDRSYGYSLIDLPTGFVKLALTPVDPGAFAFSPSGKRAYLTLDGGDAPTAVARVQVLDLDTFVIHDLDLGSPPEAVGVLPNAGVAFVSQRHALGRVTFIDLDTRATHTLTGFELGSHIVD